MLHLLRAAKRGKGGAPPPAAPAALSDSLRYGAFLASLAGVYVGVDESIAAVWGRQRCAADTRRVQRGFTYQFMQQGQQNAQGWLICCAGYDAPLFRRALRLRMHSMKESTMNLARR